MRMMTGIIECARIQNGVKIFPPQFLLLRREKVETFHGSFDALRKVLLEVPFSIERYLDLCCVAVTSD
jgi:hypothetical protein